MRIESELALIERDYEAGNITWTEMIEQEKDIYSELETEKGGENNE
jgi:hypothetical protein